MKKLNSLGIAHLLIPLIVVVVGVAAVGTYMLVSSSAATRHKPDVQPGVAQPISDNEPLVAPRHFGAGDYIASTARNELGKGKIKSSWPDGAWCAAFATWTWRKNGVNIPAYTYVPDIKHWAKKHNRWHTGHPKVGDMALYGGDHVGIVVGVKGHQVKMIDGNWSNRVSIHTAGRNYEEGNWGKASHFYAGSQRLTGFVSP